MIGKYYSLDECSNQEEVLSYLESLQEEGKIYFEVVDLDIIKFKDIDGLNPKELKDLSSYLYENDVLEYSDYKSGSYYDEEDFDDDYDEYKDDDDF